LSPQNDFSEAIFWLFSLTPGQLGIYLGLGLGRGQIAPFGGRVPPVKGGVKGVAHVV